MCTRCGYHEPGPEAHEASFIVVLGRGRRNLLSEVDELICDKERTDRQTDRQTDRVVMW